MLLISKLLTIQFKLILKKFMLRNKLCMSLLLDIKLGLNERKYNAILILKGKLKMTAWVMSNRNFVIVMSL